MKQGLLSRATFTLHPLRLQLPPPLPPRRPRERLQLWPLPFRSPFRCPRLLRRYRRRLLHRQRPRRTPLRVLHCLHHPRPQPPLRGPPGREQSLLSSREGLCLTGRCRVSSLKGVGLQGTGWRHSTFRWSLVVLFLLFIIFVIILVLFVAHIPAWALARDSPEVYLRSSNTRKVMRHITHTWRIQRAHGADLRTMEELGIESRTTL